MPTEFCPDCEMPIRIEPRPRIGQRLTCPHCSTSLKVIEISPLEFYWVNDERPVATKAVKNRMASRAGSDKDMRTPKELQP